MKTARMCCLATTICVTLITSGYGSQRGLASPQPQPGTNHRSADFSDGEANFRIVLQRLEDSFVDQDLRPDDLYRAATQGLLANIDSSKEPWNQLLTQAQYKSETENNSGHLGGIGIVVKFIKDDGMGLVLDVLPDTAAATGGIKANDLILSVDGQTFAGRMAEDLTAALRGAAGTDVGLTILRSGKILGFNLHRQALKVQVEEASRLPDGTGYLAIPSLVDQSADNVRKLLTELGSTDVSALIVDLRGCEGGSFAAALATAGLFVSPGAPLAVIRHRGGVQQTEVAAGGPVLKQLPISVLIDADTGGGCELIAGSLKQQAGAVIVGKKSRGKWSLQALEELPNHYAMKYTVARYAPAGLAVVPGQGLDPDIPVDSLGPQQFPVKIALTERLVGDAALQAAHRLLSRGQQP